MKPHPHLAWLALVLGGCANPSHLVFHQKTSFGVDAATDTTTGRITVDAGYHRETNAFVPKTRVNGGHEAMSTISLTDIRVQFLGLHEVNEQFATGDAAQLLATKPDALGHLTTLNEIAKPAPGTP